MRIEIDIGVAKDPESIDWLDRIMHKIQDGWHVWDTRSIQDFTAFKNSTWLRRNRGFIEVLDASMRSDA